MSDDTDKKPKKPRFQERDDDDDDDSPRTKKRAAADDGPRVASSERTPVLMLVAMLGSALALLGCCVGGGWYSFVMLAGEGDFGGGGSGGDVELVASRRVEGVGLNVKTTVSWTVKSRSNHSTEHWAVVVKAVTDQQEERFPGLNFGERSGTTIMRGDTGAVEVWLERRSHSAASKGTRITHSLTVR